MLRALPKGWYLLWVSLGCLNVWAHTLPKQHGSYKLASTNLLSFFLAASGVSERLDVSPGFQVDFTLWPVAKRCQKTVYLVRVPKYR